jgi:hypothetical protein
MHLDLTAKVVLVGLCLIVAGVAKAAVTTTQSATYGFKRCSTCSEVRYPTEQECRAAAYAEAERVGLTRTTGAAVYTCITRFNVIGTFKANPLPPPPPIDCVVSAWGAWSDPPWLACVDGMQSRTIVRTRTIVTQPANGGTACPSLVETQAQTRACPGVVSLSWTPPTRNTDGTSLTNLAGYRIHYGTSPTALISTIQLANAGTSAYTISGLAPGTYYFAVRAYSSSGTESSNSNVGSKVVQ